MKRNQNIKVKPGADKQNPKETGDRLTSATEPFLVPEGYFDELPKRVLDKISEDQKTLPKSINLLKQAWIPLALAASVALFILIKQPSTLQNNSGLSDTIAVTSHSDDYDPTYAEEALMIEESSITENDEAQIDFNSMSIALNNSDTTDITTDEMIQYLLDENYDIDLITDL